MAKKGKITPIPKSRVSKLIASELVKEILTVLCVTVVVLIILWVLSGIFGANTLMKNATEGSTYSPDKKSSTLELAPKFNTSEGNGTVVK